MNKKTFLEDFGKIRGALLAQIENNKVIDTSLIEQFSNNNFSLLEEHTAISKIILDSTKALTEAYKQAGTILDGVKEEKEVINMDALLKKMEEKENKENKENKDE